MLIVYVLKEYIDSNFPPRQWKNHNSVIQHSSSVNFFFFFLKKVKPITEVLKVGFQFLSHGRNKSYNKSRNESIFHNLYLKEHFMVGY